MSTIILKNSTVAGKVPLTTDLLDGELALNSADGKMYMKLSSGVVKELGGVNTGGWVRNPTWMAMPATTSAQEQVDALVAVWPESNYIAFNVTCVGGYTIDWGDGSAPQNFASATQADYLYDFNAAGLSTTDQIYKTAMVKITPTVGGNSMTSLSLGPKNSTNNLGVYTQPLLDVTISTACTSMNFGQTIIPPRMMERVTMLRHSMTSFSNVFINCSALQSVPLFNTSAVTNMSSMFAGCSSFTAVPLFDTGNVTTMQQMFSTCVSLQSVPLFNTAKVTTFNGMFNGCAALKTVPLFNTPLNTSMANTFFGCSSLLTVPLWNCVKVTTFGGAFSNCVSLQSIPSFDTTAATGTVCFAGFASGCSALQQVGDIIWNRAAITNATAYGTFFSNCGALSKIGSGIADTGPKFTFTVAQCKLSAAALNTLYTSLPVVTAQTITVTGNVGTAGDDPTIATAKGWTTTGTLLTEDPTERSGFYKWQSDENVLIRAGDFVHGPGFDLYAADHETYQLPIDGWYWFDDESQARTFLNVPIDAVFQE